MASCNVSGLRYVVVLKLMKLKRSVLSAILFLSLLANAVAQTVQVPSSHENTSVEEILLPPPKGSYPVGRASFHRIDASQLRLGGAFQFKLTLRLTHLFNRDKINV